MPSVTATKCQSPHNREGLCVIWPRTEEPLAWHVSRVPGTLGQGEGHSFDQVPVQGVPGVRGAHHY